jgi:hypothetical protein
MEIEDSQFKFRRTKGILSFLRGNNFDILRDIVKIGK